MLMPGSEISQLSDPELVEAAGAASEERTQRRIQAEMWRRTTLEARRADLAALERGRRGETIALWAIELALLAILLVLVLLGSSIDFGGSSDNAVVGGIIVTVTAVLGNGIVLLVTANERAVARARLREFDSQQ
jgi:hypothetical protein